jgi:hypothetical protein
MLSPRHAIAIQIRRLPRQRRKIERPSHPRRESPLLPKRHETRPHRGVRRPPRRIPGRLRGPPRRPRNPLSTLRRGRTGPGPHPGPSPLAPPPHPRPRIPRVRQRDHSPRRANRRGIHRDRRPRPHRLRFPETSRPQPGPAAPNPLRSLPNPPPRPYLQAPTKITKRTQAPRHPAKSRSPKSHSASRHPARRSSPMRKRGAIPCPPSGWRELQLAASASADVPCRPCHFISDLNTSIAFSICRS